MAPTNLQVDPPHPTPVPFKFPALVGSRLSLMGC